MIRLIAIDIDGTLLDSHGQVSDANRRAIARALDSGIAIVLATGRRYEFARPVFSSLPGPLTLILSNGAIIKTQDGRTLWRTLLPRGVARHVLERTLAHRESAALIFDRAREGQVVYESVDWENPAHSRYFHANRPYIVEVRPLEDALTEDPVQIMFTGPCARMRALFDELANAEPPREHGADTVADIARGEAGGLPYAVALTEYGHRDFSLVDVVRAGCSKGTGLRRWAEEAGIARHEVMAIGDNLNDQQMLEYAGLPVLMANAPAELKERGWALTGTNDEDGVARAIETLAVGRTS